MLVLVIATVAMVSYVRRLCSFALYLPILCVKLPYDATLSLLEHTNTCIAHLLGYLGRPTASSREITALRAGLKDCSICKEQYRTQAEELDTHLQEARSKVERLKTKYQELKRRVVAAERDVKQSKASLARSSTAARPGAATRQALLTGSAQGRSWQVHLLAALCGISVYCYSCAEEDLLEKKMIAALAWPLLWMYLLLLLCGLSTRSWLRRTMVYCCSALLGYVAHGAVHVCLATGGSRARTLQGL